MANIKYILTSEQLQKIKLKDLKCLGNITPNEYNRMLLKRINRSELKIETHHTGGLPLNFIKQSEKVTVEDSSFLLILICNPYPYEKKYKPSGLVFDDLSYLQFKEVLFYDYREKELYTLEYSYHYGIWDFEENRETYYFRYDRDILLKNPPKKKIEHFHVQYDKPHFNSCFIRFEDTIQFIEDNWDYQEDCFELDISL